jgi:deoxyhypusine synthase
MRRIKQIKIKGSMTTSDLAQEMSEAGVLGAGRFSAAVEICSELFSNKRYTNILSIAGPLVPAGLRQIIRDLVHDRMIDAIVTTGANITHDLIEAVGYRHTVGTSSANDLALRRKNIGRIYDIYISQRAYQKLEKEAYKILADIDQQKRKNISTYELLWEFGKRIQDDTSIVRTAQRRTVPIFCPGIFDSMLGMNLWTFSQTNTLMINPFLDFSKLVDMSYEADKVGVIILGGGVPKHHVLAANILRGGVDAAIQVTFDRPEAGGLSGAPLEEAISWNKIANKGNLATVIGDATMIFPMIVLAALQRRSKKRSSSK